MNRDDELLAQLYMNARAMLQTIADLLRFQVTQWEEMSSKVQDKDVTLYLSKIVDHLMGYGL